MKFSTLLCSIALAVAVSPGIYAQEGAPSGQEMGPGQMGPGQMGPGGMRGRGPEGPQTELEGHMKKIEDAYKLLRAGQSADATDPAKKDAALAQIAIIRTQMTAALDLKPDYTKAQPEDKQAQFVDDFHAEVKKFLSTLDQFEAAVKAGKSDDAATLYKTLEDIQQEGHKTYRAPRPQRGGPGGMRGGPGGMPGGMGGMPQGGMGGMPQGGN